MARVLKMGNGRWRFRLSSGPCEQAGDAPGLLVEREEDEAAPPRHCTPVIWGSMVTWLHFGC